MQPLRLGISRLMEAAAAVSECSKKYLALVLIAPTHRTHMTHLPHLRHPDPAFKGPSANEIAGAKHLHFELVKLLSACVCCMLINSQHKHTHLHEWQKRSHTHTLANMGGGSHTHRRASVGHPIT